MYSHDISRVMSPVAGQNGVSEPVFKRTLGRAMNALQQLQAQKLPLLEKCADMSDLPAILARAESIRGRFSTVVVCGMGGSSLSGKMLSELARNPFTQSCGAVQLFFVENIDPHSMDQLVGSVDFASTLFIVISKSGGTAETMTHISILWREAESRLGGAAGKHFLVIAEARDNPLMRFATARGIESMEHDPGIGGRYAALTVVGLLPAAVAGLDIGAVRNAAADLFHNAVRHPEQAAPVQGAALSHILAEQGKSISVLMPYCDRLHSFALWHRQIWAESLGKKSKGITPAPALGSMDQHSQLQLYLDGPRDKFFTLMVLDQCDKGALISDTPDEALSYLKNHTIGDLMDAHQYATLETLSLRHCPVRLMALPALDERALGALTMHFMLETILTGMLMEIDPFDQPAVEEGKKLAIQRLNRGCK